MPEDDVESPAAPTTWLTPEEARARWLDAPEDEAQLAELLEAAREACEAYAPAEDDPERPGWPALRRAQETHVRNLWNAALAAPSSGDFGEGSYTVSTHPLDWHVKQMLRPARAVPVVG
ncbi:hypothetical protein ACFPZL_01140 [Leucobacter soli]|uniref:Phage protein n=1 Tax=Leucobacter soli TaxID=2812850 RepID=A0A916NPX7_9MICO|nr:hypothetical protein [Leucobacter soli]CAG7618417.1 hypothetical protein LEUCIP111803_02202 [Leucobacter soli]